jgi:metal-responsive CopG/Arc/MetJ family transcriptional regulator
MQKPRSPGNTACSISLPVGLLREIDERAAALGLSRSQYLSHLARADIERRGNLVLAEKPTPYKTQNGA